MHFLRPRLSSYVNTVNKEWTDEKTDERIKLLRKLSYHLDQGIKYAIYNAYEGDPPDYSKALQLGILDSELIETHKLVEAHQVFVSAYTQNPKFKGKDLKPYVQKNIKRTATELDAQMLVMKSWIKKYTNKNFTAGNLEEDSGFNFHMANTAKLDKVKSIISESTNVISGSIAHDFGALLESYNPITTIGFMESVRESSASEIIKYADIILVEATLGVEFMQSFIKGADLPEASLESFISDCDAALSVPSNEAHKTAVLECRRLAQEQLKRKDSMGYVRESTIMALDTKLHTHSVLESSAYTVEKEVDRVLYGINADPSLAQDYTALVNQLKKEKNIISVINPVSFLVKNTMILIAAPALLASAILAIVSVPPLIVAGMIQYKNQRKYIMSYERILTTEIQKVEEVLPTVSGDKKAAMKKYLESLVEARNIIYSSNAPVTESIGDITLQEIENMRKYGNYAGIPDNEKMSAIEHEFAVEFANTFLTDGDEINLESFNKMMRSVNQYEVLMEKKSTIAHSFKIYSKMSPSQLLAIALVGNLIIYIDYIGRFTKNSEGKSFFDEVDNKYAQFSRAAKSAKTKEDILLYIKQAERLSHSLETNKKKIAMINNGFGGEDGIPAKLRIHYIESMIIRVDNLKEDLEKKMKTVMEGYDDFDDDDIMTEGEMTSILESYGLANADLVLDENMEVVEEAGRKGIRRKIALQGEKVSHGITNTVRKVGSSGKHAAVVTKRIPQHVDNLVNNTLNNLRDMDRNERRNRIVEGGYRLKLYKIIGDAALVGGAYLVNPALAAIGLIAGIAVDKNLDRRTRRRIVDELEDELKIVNEKIRDSDMNRDKNQKYQLMRIKNKLEKDIQRIHYGLKV